MKNKNNFTKLKKNRYAGNLTLGMKLFIFSRNWFKNHEKKADRTESLRNRVLINRSVFDVEDRKEKDDEKSTSRIHV